MIYWERFVGDAAYRGAELRTSAEDAPRVAHFCGNDAGTLTESTWSKSEVYDSPAKLAETQWATHYTYVKSKVEQERAARRAAAYDPAERRVSLVLGSLSASALAPRVARSSSYAAVTSGSAVAAPHPGARARRCTRRCRRAS